MNSLTTINTSICGCREKFELSRPPSPQFTATKSQIYPKALFTKTMTPTPDSNASAAKPYNIAIIGGGIGGVVLAIGLLRHNIPVHIYESASSFGEIGAGIAFGPNSTRALALVSPDLLTAYKKHATYNEGGLHAATFLTFRHGMDSVDGVGGRKAGDVAFEVGSEKHAGSWTGTCVRSCVHRARFLDEIIKFVPEGTASFGKSLVALEEVNEEGGEGGGGRGVRMRFADGSEAFADAVVGCDGIKSKTREALYGDMLTPRFTGEYAYRAMVPAEAAIQVLGREMAVNGQLYIGRGAYFITYPVEHGRLINMVALICKPESEWTHDTWLKPSTREEVVAELKGWHPGLVRLLADHGTRDKWALHDLMHEEKFSRGRVCLLGDSSHASTPHLGAGAGSAIGDAYILSNILTTIDKKEDLTRAFLAYDSVRRPRTQRVVNISRAQGIAVAFLDKNVGEDEEALKKDTFDRYDWVWDEDLEKQLEEAMASLES